VFFLQTNGSGVLSFSSPSSDFVLLATTDASSSASVSFDGYFSSTYKNYKIIISNLVPANNNNTIGIRFRRSNADVTSSYNSVILFTNSVDTSGGITASGIASTTTYIIGSVFTSVSNETTYNSSGVIDLFDPLGTNNYKNVILTNCSKLSGGNWWYIVNGTGTLTDATTALSGITFYMTSGNITRGNFKLYGIK
jgi:hypothetical protein